jgi:hypothetical protein
VEQATTAMGSIAAAIQRITCARFGNRAVFCVVITFASLSS